MVNNNTHRAYDIPINWATPWLQPSSSSTSSTTVTTQPQTAISPSTYSVIEPSTGSHHILHSSTELKNILDPFPHGVLNYEIRNFDFSQDPTLLQTLAFQLYHKANGQVRSVIFENCVFSGNHLKEFLLYIDKVTDNRYNNLRMLRIVSQPLDDSFIHPLRHFMYNTQNDRCQPERKNTLELVNCSISDEFLKLVQEERILFPNVFELSQQHLSAASVSLLANAISYGFVNGKLYLEKCYLSASDIDTLTTSVSAMPAFSLISLQGNKMSDDSAVALIKAFASLESINLAGCGLDCKNVISNALSDLRDAIEIDFRGNVINENGNLCMSEQAKERLKGSKNLTFVFDTNDQTNRHIQSIRDFFKDYPNVTIKQSDYKELADMPISASNSFGSTAAPSQPGFELPTDLLQSLVDQSAPKELDELASLLTSEDEDLITTAMPLLLEQSSSVVGYASDGLLTLDLATVGDKLTPIAFRNLLQEVKLSEGMIITNAALKNPELISVLTDVFNQEANRLTVLHFHSTILSLDCLKKLLHDLDGSRMTQFAFSNNSYSLEFISTLVKGCIFANNQLKFPKLKIFGISGYMSDPVQGLDVIQKSSFVSEMQKISGSPIIYATSNVNDGAFQFIFSPKDHKPITLTPKFLEEILGRDEQEKRSYLGFLLSKQFSINNVNSDGDCLFSALLTVSPALKDMFGNVQNMRNAIADHLLENKNAFASFVSSAEGSIENIASSIRQAADETRHGFWGGELEVRLLLNWAESIGFDLAVHIYDLEYFTPSNVEQCVQDSKLVPPDFLRYGSETGDVLSIMRKSNHYYALLPLVSSRKRSVEEQGPESPKRQELA